MMSTVAMAADDGASAAAGTEDRAARSEGRQPYVLGERLSAPGADKARATPRDGDADGSARDAAAERHGKTAGSRGNTDDEAAATTTYRPLDWAELIPPDWEPLKDFQVLDFSSMSDSDPRAIAALKKLQSAWKHAPLNPAIEEEKIEIAGFIVPLDSSDPKTIEEMLLVPYFGACIHVPPPPANQIIHVVLEKPLKGFQMMDPVTVKGTLRPSRSDTPYGSSGYRLTARQVSAYEEPPEQALEEHP
ncbi:MAG: DUF3299 domain-containing protein [Lautropia sp.]|nr:DUF3299 domain-containing protein [Lautropia sp.]